MEEGTWGQLLYVLIGALVTALAAGLGKVVAAWADVAVAYARRLAGRINPEPAPDDDREHDDCHR